MQLAVMHSTYSFSIVQVRNLEAIVTELREIRSEIRWLRTENQRILEYLFARQENS